MLELEDFSVSCGKIAANMSHSTIFVKFFLNYLCPSASFIALQLVAEMTEFKYSKIINSHYFDERAVALS